MSSTTVAVPVVADRRDTWERTWPIASHSPLSVAGPIWRNVPYSVEPDATDPNRSGCERRCSMSEHAPTASQHQHRLGEDLAPVMKREPLPGHRDPSGERITQPQAVGKRSQRLQPDMSDDLLAAPFHHHRNRAVTVHPAGALQIRGPDASTTSESLVWWALPRMGSPQLTKPRE
jgi:hypothetical protein